MPKHGAVPVLLLCMLVWGCQDDAVPNLPLVEASQAATQADLAPVPLLDLRSPFRIALGRRGTAFLTDVLTGQVVEVDFSSGSPLPVKAYVVGGEPLGIATTGNTIIVGNGSSETVDTYRRSNGKWIGSLGAPGSVSDPTDIAVDEGDNLVFVLDGKGRTVHVFDLKKREALYTISGAGLGEFDLQNPTGIAVDVVNKEVLVSDYGEPTASGAYPRIKIFTYGGAPLVTISGRLGMLGSRFSRPQGLAVSPSGHIFVTEAVSGQTLVLDRNTGALVTTVGTFGTGPGELWLPLDVVITEGLDLLVTNNRLQRVERFPLGGQVP